jgi:hypothetical protein
MISRRSLTVLAGAAVLPAAIARAQSLEGVKPATSLKVRADDPVSAVFDGVNRGSYYPALQFARRWAEYPSSYEQTAAAQASALIGQDGWALAADEAAHKVMPPTDEARLEAREELDGVEAHLALDVIAKAARTRQVVMINEAHNVSRHRAFIGALALRLRDEGFGWYAAETFQPPVQALGRGRAFSPAMGLYSNDPTYAESVRRARDAGYRFIAYDQVDFGTARPPALSDAMIQRDQTAARHIMERVFAQEPDAKLLLHVGYSHLSRTPINEGGRSVEMLAMRLAEAGIQPLCIDQVAYSPASRPELDSPRLTEALARFRFDAPTMLVDANRKWLGLSNRSVNATVFHPSLAEIAGRSGWRAQVSGVKPVTFNSRAILESGCQLAYAFHVDEPPLAAVPADILVLDPKLSASFMLRSGKYTIRGEGPRGLVDFGQIVV